MIQIGDELTLNKNKKYKYSRKINFFENFLTNIKKSISDSFVD